MDERQSLELAACTSFVNSYNRHHHTCFQIVTHRDKPDFLIQDADTKEVIGVEITHLYFDAREAKMVLGRLSKEPHGLMKGSQLIETLNADLAEKADRAAKYEFKGSMILVVRVASPIFDKQDFDMYEEDICVPPVNPFAEIWLLFWDQATKSASDLKQIK